MANTIYANARAKALENTLLGRERLARMLDSNIDESLKILSEVNFGGGVAINSVSDFEFLIAEEEKKLIAFVKSNCPSDALKKYLLLPYDFHNAEVFVREKYLKKQLDGNTALSGLMDKSVMRDKIMLDEYKDFPDEMAGALLFCDGEFTSGKATGASVDAAFKKALYKEIYSAVRRLPDLRDIFAVKADCANVGVALRTRNFNAAKKFFVVGGKLSEEELKLIAEESFDVLKEKCKFMPVGEMIAVALDGKIKEEPLSDFETKADDYALSVLKKKRYSTDGIVPFMLYCFYKQAELKNVRIILAGLINQADKNEIKRRLRESI